MGDFTCADNARAIMSWQRFHQCAAVCRVVPPKIKDWPQCEVCETAASLWKSQHIFYKVNNISEDQFLSSMRTGKHWCS